MTPTDLAKDLIERARGRGIVEPYPLIRDLASSLESSLTRIAELEERCRLAEGVCHLAEDMRDVSIDLKTALGLEYRVHDALDAWRSHVTAKKEGGG